MSGIFTTKIDKVIVEILKTPDEIILVRTLAKKLKVSPATVSLSLSKMRKLNMVNKNSVKSKDALVRALKIVANIEKIRSYAKIIYRTLGGQGIGIYGSWAKGTNSWESDIDIWIKVHKYPDATVIAKVRSFIRKKTGKEIGFLFLTKEKLEELKINNPPLYFSLLYSFHLGGEMLD